MSEEQVQKKPKLTESPDETKLTTDKPRILATHCTPKQVVFSKSYGGKFSEVTLREFKECDCDGAVLVEAFSASEKSLSLSQIVGTFLVDSLKLPLIGDITSLAFPPLVVVKDAQPTNNCRFYGNKNIVVFLCDYKFSPELSWSLSKAIYDFATRHQNEEILLIKGIQPPSENQDLIQVKEPEKEPETKEELMAMLEKATKKRGDEKLWFCTNNEAFADKLIGMGHKPAQDVIVRGISGAILAEACYTNVNVAALFSAIDELNKFFQIDARAALSIVQCIAELLKGKVTLDVGLLDKDLTSVNDKIVDLIKSLASPVPGTQPKQLDYFM